MDELSESRVEHLVFIWINTFGLNGASLINKIEGTPIHMIISELCIIYNYMHACVIYLIITSNITLLLSIALQR